MNRFFLGLFLLIGIQLSGQTTDSSSPYELDWAVDGTYVAASLGLNVLGLNLIKNKPALSEDYVSGLSNQDVFAIDRWAAGNYSEAADELSYIPFHASFIMPVLFLLGEDERKNAGHIAVLYLESMATAGALFTISAGAIQRSRPLVYNTSLPMRERMDKDNQRSFFAGHVVATGAATFFFAKIFHDFNPDSWAKPYIWTAAALVPAWVGYLRIKAGMHFLTDVILGYGIGALSGILVPELHKKKNSNFSFYPSYGRDYQGIGIGYRF